MSFFMTGVTILAASPPTWAEVVTEIGARNVAATPLAKGTVFVSPDGNGTGRSVSDPCGLENLDLYKGKLRVKPGDVVFFRDNTVEGCNIHHNHLSGLGIANIADGYSTKDSGGSHNVVRDNLIHNNSDVGLLHHNYGDGDNADGVIIHISIDPESSQFLVPAIGSGFEGIGARASEDK